MDRNETIAAIRIALKRRSGKRWSVTGGRGTGYGWIRICALGTTWMTDEQCVELGHLLGKERVHPQGKSIPASGDYRREYIDRAEGRTPSKIAQPYWD